LATIPLLIPAGLTIPTGCQTEATSVTCKFPLL
jgi:hypothetical protein